MSDDSLTEKITEAVNGIVNKFFDAILPKKPAESGTEAAAKPAESAPAAAKPAAAKPAAAETAQAPANEGQKHTTTGSAAYKPQPAKVPEGIVKEEAVTFPTVRTSRSERYDSQGKLKYISETSYDAEDRITRHATLTSQGSEMCAFVHTYTADGRKLTGDWCFTRDGLLMLTEYFYNDKKQLLMEQWHGSEQYHTVGNMSFYTYDENGLQTMKEYYERWYEDNSHGDPSFTFFEYNENGKVIKQTGYRKIDRTQEIYTRITEWTDFGKISKYTNYDPDGKIQFWVVYLYDGENCIGTDTYGPDGKLQSSSRK